MNKILVGICLFGSAYSFAGNPKYRLDERVKFKVPYFYSLVCRDVARIAEVYENSKDETEYSVYTDTLKTAVISTCPRLTIKEKEIIGVVVK